MVSTPEGVFKVRTVRRKGSHEERWNWEEFDMFRGSPWEPIPGRAGIETIANIGKERGPCEVIERNIGEDAPIVKRAFEIKGEDVLKE